MSTIEPRPDRDSEDIRASARVRVTRRDQESTETLDQRSAFWMPLTRRHEQSLAYLEGNLCRRLGHELKNALRGSLDEAAWEVERQVERFAERFSRGFGSRELEYPGDVAARWADARREFLRSQPAARDAIEKRILAAQVWFSVRILGYKSLGLEIGFGPVEKLAAIFDDNFDTFRVFLEVFIPVAFANVFDESFADSLDYEVIVPSALRQSFKAPRATSVSQSALSVAEPPVDRPANDGRQKALERAQWYWNLANGSLLVPFVLALVVMLYSVRELARIIHQSRAQKRSGHSQVLVF